jgi:PmbA protein
MVLARDKALRRADFPDRLVVRAMTVFQLVGLGTGGTSQQLIAEADNAILVTDFNGGNCDTSTGNFSYGIEGLLIQGGIVTQPVSGMNITGNILDVWNRVSDLGNDADPWETELIPSIVFQDVCFGGL